MKLPGAVRSALPYLLNGLIRAVRRTMRIRYVGRETIDGFIRADRPFILAFWHNRLLLMRYAYPGKRITILVSRHRDGDLSARTLQLFGLDTSRGSSTAGGAAGLRSLVRRVREGYCAAFTPDGPRGPSRSAQPGVILAAQLAEVPIVPVSFGASKKKF